MAGDPDSRIRIHSGDITQLEVDAVVNAANSALRPGGGVCGAIHRAAGPELAAACGQIGGCPTGEARVTGAYGLPAKRVIHTVGPVWEGGTRDEPGLLASCYRTCLKIAVQEGLTSIAFPAISTGVYGFPLAQAAGIAVATVREFLSRDDRLERVVFCVFGPDAEAAYRDALGR
jgi:O-acetyl-ADP-ribose deacetylase (regulator of RNase III)